MHRLEGRVALVTGGAAGLGKAIAERLAVEGAKVVISDIDAAQGERAAREAGYTFLVQDVTNEAAWPMLIAEIEQRFGKLEILVNNAGIIGSREAVTPESTQLEEWRRIFAINVESVFLGCRAAIPAMRRAGRGSIINMASVAGLRAGPFAMAYSASKATIRQMTKTVAQYCAEQGLNIRCNSVHPGTVHTSMWEKIAAEDARRRDMSISAVLDEARARAPLNALTQPEDVAATVAFLASDDAARITGSKFLVDAGIVDCDTFYLSERFKAAICSPKT